ncbi:hypothetical protein QJQ45_024076, partial [Haematococcus lacustris]
EDEEGAQDDVAAASGSQADAGKRRGKATPGANALDASATLADPAGLREKRSEMTFENDPLFNRTTKLFDENSPAGLLLLNYPVYYNCTVLFDSCDRPMAAFPDLPTLPAAPHPQVDLSKTPGLQELLAATPGLTITPSFTELHAELPSKGGGPGSMPTLNNAAILQAAIEHEGLPVRPPTTVHLGGISCIAGITAPSVSTARQPASSHQGQESLPHALLASPPPSPPQGFAPEGWQGGEGGAEWDDLPGECQPQLETGAVLAAAAAGAEPQPLAVTAPGFGALLAASLATGEDRDADQAEEEEGTQSSLDGLLPSYSAAVAAKSQARSTAWAGSAFWRFRPPPPAQPAASGVTSTKPRAKAKVLVPYVVEGEFQASEEQMRMATDKELRLKRANKAGTLLPADTHYQTSRLYELSCTPGLGLIRWWQLNQASKQRQARQVTASGLALAQQGSSMGTSGADDAQPSDHEAGAGPELTNSSWTPDMADDSYGGGGDEEEVQAEEVEQAGGAGQAAGAPGGVGWDPLSLDALLPQARKVARVEIQYDRSAKQVNVKALKATLKARMEGLQQQAAGACPQHQPAPQPSGLSFQQVIQQLPEEGSAGAVKDISVHLCFICLLHLANEHGLALGNRGQLDQLHIQLPNSGLT